MVADWLTPEEMVSAANKAGWVGAEFVDLTPDIRLSFELMGRKVCRCEGAGITDNDPPLTDAPWSNGKQSAALLGAIAIHEGNTA